MNYFEDVSGSFNAVMMARAITVSGTADSPLPALLVMPAKSL